DAAAEPRRRNGHEQSRCLSGARTHPRPARRRPQGAQHVRARPGSTARPPRIEGGSGRTTMTFWLLLALASGELEVRSHTDGAEVYVDGKPAGRVPLDKPLTLSGGQHTLKVTKRGYADFLDVVTVRPHKRQSVDVDLLPVVGVLRLYATVPGARVFVD